MEVTRPGPDEMYCFNCGSIIKRQAETCVKCAVRMIGPPPSTEAARVSAVPSAAEVARPGPDEMYCSSCGAIIKRRAEICVKCGVRVMGPPGEGVGEFSGKSRLTAGILGIVLGNIGVHRFYLGNVGIGILQIIVTIITFGIGSVWGFIEGIIILVGGSWKDAKGRPLKKYNE